MSIIFYYKSCKYSYFYTYWLTLFFDVLLIFRCHFPRLGSAEKDDRIMLLGAKEATGGWYGIERQCDPCGHHRCDRAFGRFSGKCGGPGDPAAVIRDREPHGLALRVLRQPRHLRRRHVA